MPRTTPLAFLSEAAAAFVLLTNLPGAWAVRGAWPEPGRCVWAYPVVGLVVGALGAAVLVGLERAGVPALPASVLAVAVLALVTGGLHEDGLADCSDALGGGRTVERRLAIMRDSRIGAHGALALVLVMLLRVGCLASMSSGRAGLALVAASVLGRGAMLVVISGVGPARAEGLAAPLGGAGRGRIGAGLLVSLMIALVLGVAAAAAAAIAAVVTGRVARARFGGFTGDVLGAAEMLAEAAALLVAAS